MMMIHRKKGYGTLHNPNRFSVGPFLFHVGVARRVRGRKKVFRSGTFADDYYNSKDQESYSWAFRRNEDKTNHRFQRETHERSFDERSCGPDYSFGYNSVSRGNRFLTH
jgi:hypothetical protein